MHTVYFNFQGNAVLAVLAFLGTGLVLFLAAVSSVVLLATRRTKPARWVFVFACAVLGLYAAILVTFSLASHEQVVELREEKYFCEVDCHLAYAVIDVKRIGTLGNVPNLLQAAGVFYVVKLNVRFDERTISSRRPPGMPLTPNPCAVAVFDESGRVFLPSPGALRALEVAEGRQVPLTQSLLPGESYSKELVFDLPADIRNPRLLIIESDFVTRLLIGHENSFFHKKTLFRLEPPPASQAGSTQHVPAL